jgi:hypothetical protein
MTVRHRREFTTDRRSVGLGRPDPPASSVDDHAINVIAKVNGQINTRGVRRIDADGKTMTIDVVAIDPSGKETPIKLVFKRVAGK